MNKKNDPSDAGTEKSCTASPSCADERVKMAALAQETACADDWKNDPDYPHCTGSFIQRWCTDSVIDGAGQEIECSGNSSRSPVQSVDGTVGSIRSEIIRIFFAGDSTAQYNSAVTYPQTGWVQALCLFASGAQIINYAKNGRSTKSFIAEGRFAALSAELRAGDFVFIQFGHNDEKMEDPLRGTEPFGSFTDNLLYFAQAVRSHGAHPVFFTPIIRRLFNEDGTVKESHGVYPQAMMKAAAKCGVLCIDMNRQTKTITEQAGEIGSRRYFMFFEAGEYKNYPEGKKDNSHLRYEGAVMAAEAAAKLIVQSCEKTDSSSPYRVLASVFRQNSGL